MTYCANCGSPLDQCNESTVPKCHPQCQAPRRFHAPAYRSRKYYNRGSFLISVSGNLSGGHPGLIRCEREVSARNWP